MNFKLLFSVIICCVIGLGGALAQEVKKADIIGVIVDEESQPLGSATLMLLNAADSTLIGFATTEPDGAFKINNVKAGAYLLKTNFLGYAPNYQEVNIGSVDVADLGNVELTPTSEVLGEVEVTADYIPIEISKDTISYNADAFTTLPNAAVEDLLKKLPGVEVDKDGNIKAQGEDVQKILVDGKEFFGTDPKIATKNLPADAIEKVQVFDQQSEMAEFTGIDDGDREKTINLTLKEDKKKGVFGNLEGGYGTDDRYNAKVSLNRFNKKSQLSILGMANNINQQGFSMSEFVGFSGGMSSLMRAGGGRVSVGGSGSSVPISDGMSDGLAKTLAGGLNYNVEIGEKFDLRTSYFYNGINNEISQEIFRQDFVSDTSGRSGTIESFTDSENNTKSMGHRVNVNAEFEIDSTSNIELKSNVGLSSGDYANIELTETYNTRSELTNRGLSDYNSDSDDINFTGDLFYRKRFGAKRGRSLTANLNLTTKNMDGQGYLRSINEFLVSDSTLLIQQNQLQTSDDLRWGGKLAYTEPIGKNTWLELNYQYQDNKNESDKEFYDIDSTSEEGILNPFLSTFYTRNYDFHRGGATFRMNKGKSSLNIGLQYQSADLEGFINDNETPISRDINNFLPNLRFRYEFATARSMRFDYRTSISVPSLEQLSPIVDNTDPLRVYIGNPNLEEEYVHTSSLHFHSFSQFSNTSFFAMMRGVLTNNKIVNSSFFDSDLRQITTPTNIDNDWRLSLYGSFSTPLNFMKSRIRANINSSYNRSQVFINTIHNDLDRWNHRLGLSFQNLNSDILEYDVGGSWTYNTTDYSENSSVDQSYFIQNYYTEITVNFLKTWSVTTSFDISFYKGDQFQGDETLPIWKASISKYVFEDRRGEIKLSVFDILDENRGISRTAESNYLQEVRSNSLGQYVMLSFVYSIKGFGQPAEPSFIHTRRR